MIDLDGSAQLRKGEVMMETATEEARIVVEKRKDAARDYRKLLTRWTVTAGREHKSLAALTLAVMNGEDYDSVVGKVVL